MYIIITDTFITDILLHLSLLFSLSNESNLIYLLITDVKWKAQHKLLVVQVLQYVF